MLRFFRKDQNRKFIAESPSSVTASVPADTFCVGPWIQQMTLPSGVYGYCCVAQNGGQLRKSPDESLNSPAHTFQRVWNSDEMRSIRKAMLAGEKISGCRKCYYLESIGKKSSREMLNDEWMAKIPAEVKRRVEYSRQNDGAVEGGALYLDLRLGNLCNLKCRSCNPYNSTKLMAEAMEMTQADPVFRDFYLNNGSWKLKKILPWYEEENFWLSVEQHLPTLRKLYMTGGEPTLIKRNLKFLEHCIESGHSRHIFLMISTNCMYLTDDFLKLLPEFEFTLVNCSVDALGPEGDYIRDGSNWETVDSNLRKLVQLSAKVQIGITPVVQVFNILSLSGLLDYVEELNSLSRRDLNVDFLFANEPDYLDIRILPEQVKFLAAQRLEAFVATSRLYKKNFFLRNSVDSCLTALRSGFPKNRDFLCERFFRMTKFLDDRRGRSFAKTFPELTSMWPEREVVAT